MQLKLNNKLKIHYYKKFYVSPVISTNKIPIKTHTQTQRKKKESKNINTKKSIKHEEKQQERKRGTKFQDKE